MKLIPKANNNRDNYPCWKGVVDQNGKIISPVFYCGCGIPCGIQSHSINAKGVVSPSVWHKKKATWELEQHEPNGCDYHENITLEGWDHGEIKAE